MDVSEFLKTLPRMGKTALCEKWLELFNKTAPNRLRKEFMVRILAYKIQENAFGGLSTTTRRRLKQISISLENGNSKLQIDPHPIKPGTRLIREWQGKTCKVSVTETGFEFQGSRYRSLSEIARLITGTRWSGPLFFGLRKGSQKVQGVSNGR
jgi:Protein of unknown function (DUF2924)